MVELNLVLCKPAVSDCISDLRENHPSSITYSVQYYSRLLLKLSSVSGRKARPKRACLKRCKMLWP